MKENRKRPLLFLMPLLALVISCSTAEVEKAVVINPTPQHIEIIKGKRMKVHQGFKLTKSFDELADALCGLVSDKEGAAALTIEFGEEVATQNGVKPLDGAYSLVAKNDSVTIIAYNERGAFYGIQTLEQLVSNDKMPEVVINDYPDIEYRGVVEGFYGTPWSHEVRKSLIEYYGKYKMNSYLYGPKDDPYHSSPYWREPYPADEAAKLKELVDVSNANRVDFVWAIHPGLDIQWTESDYQKLKAKFESMYDLGVRSYAMFFDDISGIGTKAEKQAELLNRIHKEFVLIKGDVKPLVMCPTDYTKLWADPSESGYLSILGDELDPSIHVMWTGDAICCDITDGTLEWVNSRINRPTYIWWNYPVTDYVKHIILQGPVYGNTQNANPETMSGFVSNPMEHGEASKIALYGVADYTWNVHAYDALRNWEEAIIHLMPEAADAYRTFAIHSTDTETGYRRDESWETTIFDISNYTQEQYDALYAEFQKVKAAPATIFEKDENEMLIGELRPWLIEFEKLGQRGLTALDLIKLYEKGDYNKFWDLFRTTVMTAEELETYKAHRSGTTKLTPFINTTRTNLATNFYSYLSEEPLYQVKAMSSFVNVDSELSLLMLDNNSDTYYHSAEAQKDGSWIALDLGTVTSISHIYIEQGRNNVDDVDYFDQARLEVSVDGKEWIVLRDNMMKTYVIDWSGETVAAQYVRLSRLDGSERQNWLAVRKFEINPTAAAPEFTTNIPQLAGRAVDVSGNKVSVAPALEAISVAPNGYFGVDMPVATAIKDLEIDFGVEGLSVEYSSDLKNWSKEASTAKYIRYINRTGKPVDLRLNKFSFLTLSSSDSAISAALDKDITSGYKSEVSTIFAISEGATSVVVLSDCSSHNKGSVEQLNAEGEVLSSSILNSSLSEIELDGTASTIEIKGECTLYEVIFK